MRKLVCTATILGLTSAMPAFAQDGTTTTTGTTASTAVPTDDFAPPTDETPYGASKLELGLYVGSFISNFYHQFYDADLFPVVEPGAPDSYDPDAPPNRPRLDRFDPQFGLRLAFFPHQHIGVELDASVILASTKRTGDSAQIYGLGGLAFYQWFVGKLTPYAGIGIAAKFLNSDDSVLGSDSDFPFQAALGARYWLSHSVALRVDGRFLRGPSQGHPMDNPSFTLNASYGELSLGVSFNPGAGAGHDEKLPPPVDPDPDKDGVLGLADACPTENGGTNPDGCPTRDKDGDGLADKDDKCPDQAETMNKWEDQDGCPDTIPDTDADGFNDLDDKCKDQAEDKDAFQDEDGCPDPDNDEDGVLDGKDKCPGQAGPVENFGCPDTDKDSDGIVDRLDNCPEEKGTEKNHGCKQKQLVVITKDQLKILDQVKFVTGSAKLSKASNKLLDNIARVMIAHPEIWKVRVEGHTDNVGKPEKNQKLSEGRAASVVAYLVKKGVVPERLEAQGFGDTKPIEDNSTSKGRAQNRRVEFNIVNE